MKLEINKEWVDEAVQKAVDEIKQNYIHKSVIEDIKAEMKTLVTEGENDYQLGMNGAIMRCFQIINKHISGKDNDGLDTKN